MTWMKICACAAVLVVVLPSAGCFYSVRSGSNHNDAEVGTDGMTLRDAQATGDASTAGGGTISVYLTGDLTPKTFTDGLAGQTPTSYVIALSEYWVQTSLTDPSPVFCFDNAAPVEADLEQDNLMGVCQTADLPSAVYTHGRVKVEWARYTVNGTLHYQSMPLAGEFTFFRAYSDTTYDGQSYLAGEGTITYDGPTQVSIPTTFDPPLSIPGLVQETLNGEHWMTFPYSQPLAIDQGSTAHHWARFHWEIFEGFRWQDAATTGYTDDLWDVGITVGETEAVIYPGVTGYFTTASTD